MRTGRYLCAAIVAMAATGPVFGSLIVDGNLSDWGISVANNNHSTYGISSGVTLIGVPHVEDQCDTAGDSAWLGPAYGGQNYDAEFMGVAYEGGRIFIAIVTGQRPDNGAERFAPGDIRFEANGLVYGIEVGGGSGGGSGTMISDGANGRTYMLNSNGFTVSSANAAASQTAGSIWSGATWINSTLLPIPTQFAVNGSSVNVGDAEYRYTRNSLTSQHAVIELSFDASIIGAGNAATFAWRPACDNDELIVDTLVPVPEPATILCLCAGGLVFVRRRR